MYYFIFDFLCYHVRLNMKIEPLAYFITNIITTLFANKNYFVTQNSNLLKSSVVPKPSKLPPEFLCTKLNKPKQGLWVV